MRWLLIILIFASCTPREVIKLERITTRSIDTVVVTPPDIIRETRPLIFRDTIVVENERVRTEVVIDTVTKTVYVESEVKPFEHTVKMQERTVTETKTRKRTAIFPWWAWYIAGAVSVLIVLAYTRL